MRSVINISLPKQMFDAVEDHLATGQYASKSEFFRHLLRVWMAKELKLELDRSRKELERGEGKILVSLKDFR